MVGVFLGLLWGVLLLGLDLTQTDPGALVMTILVTSFSTAGLGLMLGALSLITVNVMFVNNFVYFALLIFSGTNIPVERLPAWMQMVSSGLPLTRGLAAARALIDGASLSSVSGLLVEEFLIGVGYILVGYVFFRWFELQAKRRGTLDLL
jgi:ABC-2 type transport system permease protein